MCDRYASCSQRCRSSCGCSLKSGSTAASILRCLLGTDFFLIIKTKPANAPSAGMSISVNHVREAAYLSGCPCRTPSCEPPHPSYFSKQQGCARLSWWPFPAVLIPHLPTRVFHLQPAKKIWINSIFRARPKSVFLSFSQHGTNEFLKTQAECRRMPSFKVQMLSFSLHSNLLKLAHLFIKAC